MKPILIVFDGPDGSGKTTQIKKVEYYLKKIGYNVVLTREPGSPHIETNQTIRQMVKTDKTLSSFQRELLLMADAEAHKNFINSQGSETPTFILSDRGYFSHKIYSKALRLKEDLTSEEIKLLDKLIEKCVADPDYTFIFSVDFEVAKSRMTNRGTADVIESLGEEFLQNVNRLYKEVKTGHRVFKVDANQTEALVEQQVQKFLLRAIIKESLNWKKVSVS